MANNVTANRKLANPIEVGAALPNEEKHTPSYSLYNLSGDFASPTTCFHTTMSDAQPVPTHPVAPRVKNGAKTPHIGPDIDAYKAAHFETVGDESDEFWTKVRIIGAYNLDRILTTL